MRNWRNWVNALCLPVLGIGYLIASGGSYLFGLAVMAIAASAAACVMVTEHGKQADTHNQVTAALVPLVLLAAGAFYAYQKDTSARLGMGYRTYRAMIGCRDADAWIATEGKFTPSGKTPTDQTIRRCRDDDNDDYRDYQHEIERQGWYRLLR